MEAREDRVVQLGHVLDGGELGVVPELALEEAEVGDAGRVSYGASNTPRTPRAYSDAPMARATPFITGLLSSPAAWPDSSRV